jgi:hypothetical protein
MKICRKCCIEKEFFDFHKDSQNKDGYKHSCKECCKLQDKKYYSNNCEIILGKQKIYRKTNRKKYNINEKKKRETDPIFKLKKNLRTRLSEYVKLLGITKKQSTFEIVGLSPENLRIYLQERFLEGMTWNNYGEWHIDHITPLSSAKSENELYQLSHYSNLQPLWGKDNMSKGSKII